MRMFSKFVLKYRCRSEISSPAASKLAMLIFKCASMLQHAFPRMSTVGEGACLAYLNPEEAPPQVIPTTYFLQIAYIIKSSQLYSQSQSTPSCSALYSPLDFWWMAVENARGGDAN